MAVFNTYPKLDSLTGEEVVVLADSSGTRTVTATVSQIIEAPVSVTASGQFYSDKGAQVKRFADRLLVGVAADNPTLSDRASSSQDDWLSETMGATSIGPWALQDAQCASLAQFGNSAFVAGSRTSDAVTGKALLGFQPSSIGVASWGVSDDTSSPTTTTAYAYYGEAWRLAGVNYQPTFGMELEAVNFGGLAVGQSTPYAPNVGGGVYGIQLGAGGGQTSGTSDAAAGMVFVSNPNSWQVGIVFGAQSLTGTDGKDSGYASAVSLARNQALEWHTPETVSGVAGSNVGAFVRSTVTKRTNGMRQEFTDNGILFGNIEGETLFSVASMPSPTNALQVQAGAATQAAGLYVQEGTGGSGNLGLFPASGGELQITSPVTGTGGTMPTVANGGFLHININGADYRIPLMAPDQVGGDGMAVLYDEDKDIIRASDGSVLLDTGPAPGSVEDFAGRFRRLLPTGWFPPEPQGLEVESAPVLAAILRGFGTVLAEIWQLMQQCSLQMRFATMSGAFLDMAAEDYFGDGGLVRQASEPDVVYRKRIRAALFAERNTRQAVTNALVAATGVQPVIIETLNASDCHALACASLPAMGGGYGYGAQALRYGSLQGGQFFVETKLGKAADLATVCRVVDQTAAMGVTGWIKVKN